METLAWNERADRLDLFIAEGRLIRKKWHSTATDGRELACLLYALAPEVGDGKIDACPATLMPPWLAHLTPWIDDAGSADHWPVVIRRYAGLVRRWSVLTDADWHRLDYQCRIIALGEARAQVTIDKWGVTAALDAVVVLLRREVAGDAPTQIEWAAATRAAEAATWAAEAATRAATWATWAAAEATWAATWATWAAEAATRAAEAATRAATWATWAAAEATRAAEAATRAAAEAATRAAEAATRAAADHMIDGILDAIEATIAAREAA